jgi:hypothetical protein
MYENEEANKVIKRLSFRAEKLEYLLDVIFGIQKHQINQHTENRYFTAKNQIAALRPDPITVPGNVRQAEIIPPGIGTTNDTFH